MDEPDIAEDLRLGGLTLDLRRGELRSAKGDLVPLRKQAMDVLLELARQAGHVVGKDDLLRSVWPRVIVGDDSLAQAIAEVRRVLGDRDHRIVRTVARRGYMVVPGPIGPVPNSAEGTLEDRRGASEPVPPRLRRSTRLTHRLLPVGGALLAAITITAALLATRPDSAPSSGPPEMPALPSRALVVLPLRIDGGQAEHQWFADTLTADLTTALGNWPDLVVVGRGTALHYGGPERDPRQVARELGVRYVIQGSVGRDGDRVRLRLAMIDGESGTQSWGELFELDRAHLDRSIEDIKGGVGRTLLIEVGKSVGRRIRALDPPQVEADDLGMQGTAVLLSSVSKENFDQARRLFEMAVERDPDSIRGLGGVSLTNSMGVIFRWIEDRDAAAARAEAALTRLESIDATGHMTFLARASLTNMRSDWPGLLNVAESMVRLFPSDPTAHHHRCSALLRLARFEESIASCGRSIRISPRDTRVPIWHGLIAMNLFMQERYELAADAARHAAVGLPNIPVYWLLLAAALEHAGQPREARRVLADFRARHPAFEPQTFAKMWTGSHPAFVAGRDRVVDTVRRLEATTTARR